MYKNILVISDNTVLINRLDDLLTEHDGYGVRWSVSSSSLDLKKVSLNLLKPSVECFNLKIIEHLEFIINSYDLIISLHSKQLFPKKLLESVKCINVHPGYNPINRGWYPQVFAIINDLPIGATIHEIDNQLDHGPIIAREFVEKSNYDTSLTLYEKILNKEMQLLNDYIPLILSGSYAVFSPENKGNIFLRKDFDGLCELSLTEKSTGLEFINKLRALSHGDFKNLYFKDPKTGKKIFVKLRLEQED